MKNKEILKTVIANYEDIERTEEVTSKPSKEAYNPISYTNQELSKKDIVKLLKVSRKSENAPSYDEINEAIEDLKWYNREEYNELIKELNSGDLQVIYLNLLKEHLKNKNNELIALKAKKEQERIERERIEKVKEEDSNWLNNLKKLSRSIKAITEFNSSFWFLFFMKEDCYYKICKIDSIKCFLSTWRYVKKNKQEVFEVLEDEKIEFKIPKDLYEKTLEMTEKIAKAFRKTKKEEGCFSIYQVQKTLIEQDEMKILESLCEKNKFLADKFNEILEKFNVPYSEIRTINTEREFREEF